MQVSFTTKPPTANSYITSFNTWGNFSSATMYPVQTNQYTYLSNSLYQTANGFGLWLNDSTGGGVTSVSGQVDFFSIW
jgi:hypothetical protein